MNLKTYIKRRHHQMVQNPYQHQPTQLKKLIKTQCLNLDLVNILQYVVILEIRNYISEELWRNNVNNICKLLCGQIPAGWYPGYRRKRTRVIESLMTFSATLHPKLNL